MNALSLACSELGLLSFKKRAMHRSNIFIPRSTAHELWNASSAKGRKMSWLFRPACHVASSVEPVCSSCVSDEGATADKLNVTQTAWSMSAASLHESPSNEAF